MLDEGFEWDVAQADRTWRGHGVTFEMARRVFKDPFALECIDDSQGATEPRYSIIGLVEGRLLFVAYILRGEVIRIISARKAEPYERRKYHDDNDRA